jgi:hypothetical protein
MAPEIKKSIPEIDAKLYNELVTVAEQNGQTKRHVLEQAFRFYFGVPHGSGSVLNAPSSD